MALLNDSQIAALNRKFMDRRGPTDVLAFGMQEGRFAGISPGLLGDVVISVETALRQGRACRTGFRYELCLYLVHGILHLAGFDDTTERQRREMEARQKEILEKVL